MIFWAHMTVAWAETSEASEQKRLRADMARLLRQQHWAGLNNTYLQLLKVESLESPLLFEDHLIGAIAVQELGNLQEALERYTKAIELRPDASEAQWVSFLEDNTVSITLTARKNKDLYFQIQELPFEPELVLGIDYARQQLQEEGRFSGRLPKGTYQLNEKEFVLDETSENLSSSNSSNEKSFSVNELEGQWLISLGGAAQHVGLSEVIGVKPFTSAGGYFSLGYRLYLNQIALGGEILGAGTYHSNGDIQGGGASFWTGYRISEEVLIRLGVTYNLSYITREGTDCISCPDKELRNLDLDYIEAVPSSSGAELGGEFKLFESQWSLETLYGIRSDSERLYSMIRVGANYSF